jgi:hypothetical protein
VGLESFRCHARKWAFRLSRRRIRRSPGVCYFQGEQVQVQVATLEPAKHLLRRGVRDEWVKVASDVPGRSNRQCRLRWANHLDPNVNKEPLTDEEYDILIKAHGSMGNKWADIVTSLPGRYVNSCALAIGLV